MSSPFDAVLFVAFGGPQGPDDVRPFLQNVLRARRIPPERLEQVAHHYERFGGVSPLTEITRQQAAGLAARLEARKLALPVHVGMRNWRPLLVDTLREMASSGVRRAVAILAAAHRSYSSCEQYRQNVWQAREELRAAGVRPPDIVYVGDWHLHAGFIRAVADRITAAKDTLPAAVREAARVVFTAHSIPVAMSGAAVYQRGLSKVTDHVASAYAAGIGRAGLRRQKIEDARNWRLRTRGGRQRAYEHDRAD